ncbi:MAG: hypothetical protein WA678_01585 [Rhabdochlamydiaceae bacterium]|jgi:chromosome segregation ATPase
MEVGSPINQIRSHFTHQFCPPFEKFKSCISNHPLASRVTNNWKVILSDCSTILAVSCCAVTFFSGSAILCSAFAILAISCGINSFFMRRFSTNLETTVKKLEGTNDRLEKVALDLKRENNQITQTNRELQRTDEALRTTNRELQATSEAFRQTNTRLTSQVTQLTLQATQLRESAQQIKADMVRFQQENSHLHNNVEGFDRSLHSLDQQILASRALCDQISNHLNTQQEGLGQQLDHLRQYLADLRAENRVHERIQELGTLQQQIQQSTTQLHNLQLEYATERANFQAIHEALVQLRNQFDTAIRDAVSGFQSNNQQFRDNLSANQQQFRDNLDGLSAERERVRQLLSRYFPESQQAPQPPRPTATIS